MHWMEQEKAFEEGIDQAYVFRAKMDARLKREAVSQQPFMWKLLYHAGAVRIICIDQYLLLHQLHYKFRWWHPVFILVSIILLILLPFIGVLTFPLIMREITGRKKTILIIDDKE